MTHPAFGAPYTVNGLKAPATDEAQIVQNAGLLLGEIQTTFVDPNGTRNVAAMDYHQGA